MCFGYNWYTNCIFASRSAHQSPNNQYLYGSGWATPGRELHKQPWVEAVMDNFHSKQSKWEHQLCIVCHELWLARVCSRDSESTHQCTRCKRDKGEPKLYSLENEISHHVCKDLLKSRNVDCTCMPNHVCLSQAWWSTWVHAGTCC